MLQHGPKKKMPPFFYAQSVFFRLICVPKSLSCWKSRLCECQISYGSAPNARPSHGPSVRMEEDVRVIQATHITRGYNETPNLGMGWWHPRKRTWMEGPQNDGWEMVIPFKKWPFLGIYVKFLRCRFVALRSQFLFFLMGTNPCFAFVEKNKDGYLIRPAPVSNCSITVTSLILIASRRPIFLAKCLKFLF